MRVRPVRVEGQLAHLLERRLPDLLAEAVADVDREQAGERVEVALPVRVLEVAAVAADDDRHLGVAVAAHAGEVQPEVVAGGLLEVGGGLVVVMRLLVVAYVRICQRTLPSIERDRDQEDRARDDVHLGRHRDAGDAPDVDGERLLAAGVQKYVITKSSSESANPSSAADSIAGREQRQRDLAERRPLVRAEVHRRLLEVAVEADQPRLHGHDDEADDEHHVRDEDRPKPRTKTLVRFRKSVSSEAPSTISGVDIGRKTSRFVAAAAELVPDDRERDQRAERGRDERREQADLERDEHESRSPSTASHSSQLSSVKPCQT